MSDYGRVFRRGDYRWPSGMDRSAGTFSTSPEVITARTGLEFDRDLDDLDYFRALGLELPSGRHVVLLWYERSPMPALSLQIDLADDPAAGRRDLMTVLELVRRNFLGFRTPIPCKLNGVRP